MSKYQFQKRLMHLHQQISEFEKLDFRHRRTKTMTWLETEEKYRYMLEQTEKNACIIQDAKIRLITSNLAELLGFTQEELINTLMIKYVHPDELPKSIKYYMKRMPGEAVLLSIRPYLSKKTGLISLLKSMLV